jgi:hypothetical protein
MVAGWQVDVLQQQCKWGYHIWRQRFPNGKSEQVTSGPNEEEGIAVSSDGKSLITAAGTRRVFIALHDGAGERMVASEGRPGLAMPYDGSPFSGDGSKLYYLQLPRTSNDVGSTMLANYGAGELRQLDLRTGQSEAVVPGVSVNAFSLAPDGHRIAFVSQDEQGRRLWLASLDRRSASPSWFGSSHNPLFCERPLGPSLLRSHGEREVRARTTLFITSNAGSRPREVSPFLNEFHSPSQVSRRVALETSCAVRRHKTLRIRHLRPRVFRLPELQFMQL